MSKRIKLSPKNVLEFLDELDDNITLDEICMYLLINNLPLIQNAF